MGHQNDIRVSNHASGLEQLEISTDFCKAVVLPYAAHLLSYQPQDQKPVLFVSEKSYFEEGKPVRGGIPICFPWFSAKSLPDGSVDTNAPAHGLVRTQTWNVDETCIEGGIAKIQLGLKVNAFDLAYRLSFGRELDFEILITNRSPEIQHCELALHTYLNVTDSAQVRIEGLEQLPYRDQLTGEMEPKSNKAIRFTGETDRIYQGEVNMIELVDEAGNRRIGVRPRGSRSTVVWNPWIAKSQRMPDFGDEEYQHMCCIETANVRENGMAIAPGKTVQVGATITVSP